MMHGKYIGPEPALQNEGALLRDDPYVDGQVLAQFDNLNLPDAYKFLASNWHAFPVTCFEIDASEEGE